MGHSPLTHLTVGLKLLAGLALILFCLRCALYGIVFSLWCVLTLNLIISSLISSLITECLLMVVVISLDYSIIIYFFKTAYRLRILRRMVNMR